MSDFERHAIAELIGRATGFGIEIPEQLQSLLCGGTSGHAAVTYAEQHPDDDDATVPESMRWCCDGSAMRGLDACTCWVPVYEQEQAEPVPPASPGDITVRDRGCGDCAFRADSPERQTPWQEDALFRLADTGTPFWCHDGMRRPLRWEHPAGPVLDGDPDDWHPPKHSGVPYRADGRPALLCAGWAARAKTKEATRA